MFWPPSLTWGASFGGMTSSPVLKVHNILKLKVLKELISSWPEEWLQKVGPLSYAQLLFKDRLEKS